MKNLLILTVGTGTAGKSSNLAQGLRNTIEKIQPRCFWLVPSSSEDSFAVAELVKENSVNFAGILGPIENPDDLACCRQTIRDAIKHVRKNLRKGEELIINPVSGTKQMSAGATIAALDEKCGNIVFTVGDRADGVVITGSERIVKFDSFSYFRGRDCKSASDFFASGDFFAAKSLLEPYRECESKAYNVACLCLHWQRFDYSQATRYAAGYDQKLCGHLKTCRDSVKENRYERKIVADLLAWSFFALKHKNFEEAVRLAYKALEYAARGFLAWKFDVSPDFSGRYPVDICDRLNLSFSCRNQLNLQEKNGGIILGLYNLINILTALNVPFGEAVNQELLSLSRLRNGNTHGIQPVRESDTEEYCKKVRTVLVHHDAEFNPTVLPLQTLPFSGEEQG